MGYAIHDFILQVLIKNPERKDYTRIVWHTYLLGMTMYAFISYGCFGNYLFNSQLLSTDNPECNNLRQFKNILIMVHGKLS